MPEWVTIVGAVAAFVLAVGVLWGKVVKPGASLIILLGKMLPLAEELVEEFKDAPEAFATLADIAEQFRPNKGDSLRDVVNRLEAGIKEIRDTL